MEEMDYNLAFDILGGCVPNGKTVYAVPMQFLTPKMANKMSSIPGSAYLAKCDKILEWTKVVGQERMLLRFGDHVFEAFSKPFTLKSGMENAIICFTPRVVPSGGSDYVVLDVLGMTSAPNNQNQYVGGDSEPDYDKSSDEPACYMDERGACVEC